MKKQPQSSSPEPPQTSPLFDSDLHIHIPFSRIWPPLSFFAILAFGLHSCYEQNRTEIGKNTSRLSAVEQGVKDLRQSVDRFDGKLDRLLGYSSDWPGSGTTAEYGFYRHRER
ncbi:MAG: hypothetical protein OXC14_15415 [Rhodospirillaceae bacterium]|nr:hypothetical protein [Rhodospirillaceae bacterium]